MTDQRPPDSLLGFRMEDWDGENIFRAFRAWERARNAHYEAHPDAWSVSPVRDRVWRAVRGELRAREIEWRVDL